jgi:hypothetical protein
MAELDHPWLGVVLPSWLLHQDSSGPFAETADIKKQNNDQRHNFNFNSLLKNKEKNLP